MGGTTPPDAPSLPGDPKPTCPPKVTVTLPNPGGLNEGDKLALLLEGAAQPILVLATLGGTRLGPVAGLPGLKKLIECLKDQVPYAAHIEKITPGLLTCVIARQYG